MASMRGVGWPTVVSGGSRTREARAAFCWLIAHLPSGAIVQGRGPPGADRDDGFDVAVVVRAAADVADERRAHLLAVRDAG